MKKVNRGDKSPNNLDRRVKKPANKTGKGQMPYAGGKHS